jgi:hypothetical protein
VSAPGRGQVQSCQRIDGDEVGRHQPRDIEIDRAVTGRGRRRCRPVRPRATVSPALVLFVRHRQCAPLIGQPCPTENNSARRRNSSRRPRSSTRAASARGCWMDNWGSWGPAGGSALPTTSTFVVPPAGFEPATHGLGNRSGGWRRVPSCRVWPAQLHCSSRLATSSTTESPALDGQSDGQLAAPTTRCASPVELGRALRRVRPSDPPHRAKSSHWNIPGSEVADVSAVHIRHFDDRWTARRPTL